MEVLFFMASERLKMWTDKDHLLLVEGWSRQGLIDKQIAKNMGIAYSTFREWVKKNSALSAALKKSKEVTDFEVENSLYKAAMGYYVDEIYDEYRTNQEGQQVLVSRNVRKKYIPPNTTAQIFWLKNRQRELWKEKREEEASEEEVKLVIDDGLSEYGV